MCLVRLSLILMFSYQFIMLKKVIECEIVIRDLTNLLIFHPITNP